MDNHLSNDPNSSISTINPSLGSLVPSHNDCELVTSTNRPFAVYHSPDVPVRIVPPQAAYVKILAASSGPLPKDVHQPIYGSTTEFLHVIQMLTASHPKIITFLAGRSRVTGTDIGYLCFSSNEDAFRWTIASKQILAKHGLRLHTQRSPTSWLSWCRSAGILVYPSIWAGPQQIRDLSSWLARIPLVKYFKQTEGASGPLLIRLGRICLILPFCSGSLIFTSPLDLIFAHIETPRPRNPIFS